jgi:hypothetical protein
MLLSKPSATEAAQRKGDDSSISSSSIDSSSQEDCKKDSSTDDGVREEVVSYAQIPQQPQEHKPWWLSLLPWYALYCVNDVGILQAQ